MYKKRVFRVIKMQNHAVEGTPCRMHDVIKNIQQDGTRTPGVNPIKFYTLGQIYKLVLKLDNML